MPFVWLGALLIIAGVVYMAGQAIWRGPLSGSGRGRAPVGGQTLEPTHRGLRMFGLARNWRGLALIAVGMVLLAAGAGTSVPAP
jgi:hypothetical protein